MPTLAEIQQQANDLQLALDAEQSQVTNLLAEKDNTIATLKQTIVDLQAIIDAGGDPAALQGISDTLTTLKNDLESTVTTEQPEPGEPGEEEPTT